jgi:hypothetical protein
MAFRVRVLVAGVTLAAALALPACGGGGSNKTLVGKVEGTDAFIALVSNGKRVDGYLCDGNQVSTWFGLTDVSGGKAALSSRAGARLGEATLSGDRASGTVTIAGADHAFTADLAAGDAGLYRAAKGKLGQAGSVEVGWIVLSDDSQRGTTSFIDQTGTLMVQMAPMLDTSSTSVTLSSFGTLSVSKVTVVWLKGSLPY